MRFDSLWFKRIFSLLTIQLSISAAAEIAPFIDDPNLPLVLTSTETHPVEASLLLEFSADHQTMQSGKDELSLVTLELGGHVDLTSRVYGDVLIAYDPDADSLKLDTLVMSINHEVFAPWTLAVGQGYLPFGAFKTHQLNDTVSLELAETKQLFSGGSYQRAGFIAELYLYQNEQKEYGKLGGRFGFQNHLFHLEVDYIESLHENQALSFHGLINLQDLVVIAEHLVIEHSQQGSSLAQSKSDQLELAYQMDQIVMSLSFQASETVEEFELIQQKLSFSVRRDINQYAHLGLEFGKADGEDNLMLLLSLML